MLLKIMYKIFTRIDRYVHADQWTITNPGPHLFRTRICQTGDHPLSQDLNSVLLDEYKVNNTEDLDRDRIEI